MNKKIIISLSVIAAVAAIVIGGTVAFFSDTEISTGNTFTAGSLDLKISNTSYIKSHTTGEMVLNPGTSWDATDLTVEKFFNFTDVKPGDVGEDTIDLIVIDNPAWACAKITLTSNMDNTCTEPENEKEGKDAAGAPICGSGDPLWNGDLAQGIEFVWWADDGDNVLEVDEEATKYYLGPASISALLGEDNELLLTLADAQLNFFKQQHQNGDPLAGNTTYYIGKGWCYGEMTLTPLAEGDGSPIDRGTGFTCNGAVAGNEGQSDSLTADIEFYVEQARNNAGFLCPEHQPEIIAVQSSVFNFSQTGWAGWSCPSGHPNIVSADTTNCSQSLTHSLAWKPGASVNVPPLYSYPLTPSGYSYAVNEEGWILQNGGIAQSCYIVLQCQAN